MASFLEKLKKGMGIEEPTEETLEDNSESSIAERIRESLDDSGIKETSSENLEPEKKLASTKTQRKKRAVKTKRLEIKSISLDQNLPEDTEEKKDAVLAESPPESKDQWFKEEGQLAVDIYQTEDYLVIQSAIAGVQPENLDIIMEKDMIIIKGERKNPCGEICDYFAQECFWGPFSREVILPAEVDPNHAEATMKGGVLLIKMPKIMREKVRRITVKETA